MALHPAPVAAVAEQIRRIFSAASCRIQLVLKTPGTLRGQSLSTAGQLARTGQTLRWNDHSTRIDKEFYMYTKTIGTSARSLLGAAAVACTLVGGNVAARDLNVVVAIHVSTQGLDLSRPADAQTFYTRLESAARVACTSGDRVNLEPVDDLQGCYEKALGGAIRSAKIPMLTQIYLTNHTLQDAVAFGIQVPAQTAAK
jgi:UrcA family protein